MQDMLRNLRFPSVFAITPSWNRSSQWEGGWWWPAVMKCRRRSRESRCGCQSLLRQFYPDWRNVLVTSHPVDEVQVQPFQRRYINRGGGRRGSGGGFWCRGCVSLDSCRGSGTMMAGRFRSPRGRRHPGYSWKVSSLGIPTETVGGHLAWCCPSKRMPSSS